MTLRHSLVLLVLLLGLPVGTYADALDVILERGTLRVGVSLRSLPPAIQPNARRKLVMIDAAVDLADLAALPGNRLERLAGDRAEGLSISINRQWRICFRWAAPDAFDVEI